MERELLPEQVSSLQEHFADPDLRATWLAGDGSDRRYFRLFSQKFEVPSLVLMVLSGDDSQKLAHGNYEWLEVSKAFGEAKILVPTAVAVLKEQGMIVIDDYGDKTLQTAVEVLIEAANHSRILELYQKGFGIIQKMLSLPTEGHSCWVRRSFDYEKYEWEMRFFLRQFSDRFLQGALNSAQNLQIQDELKRLSAFLAPFSRYVVHRDYHSRNLMIAPDEELALIDFQDARLGNVYYDAVSLIFDAYVDLDLELRHKLLAHFRQNIAQSTLCGDFPKELASATLLQRQLKAIGSFAYLSVEKARGNYLKHVPRAIQLTQSLAPECRSLFPNLCELLLPAIASIRWQDAS